MARRAAKEAALKFFATPAAFRAWLRKNHRHAPELVVGFWKRDSGKPSMTWPESVDEAISFGWIDGIRHSLGPESYCIRFTPRRPGSVWSDVNFRKAKKLIEQGRMSKAGLAAFEKRQPSQYSYESRIFKIDFREHEQAWAWFSVQPPWYRRTAAYWVQSAKKPKTRARRLATLIECSAKGRRPPPFLV